MIPHYRDDRVTLHHGDCLDVLAAMPAASVDAVVTDPPAGISFMGARTRWTDAERAAVRLACPLCLLATRPASTAGPTTSRAHPAPALTCRPHLRRRARLDREDRLTMSRLAPPAGPPTHPDNVRLIAVVAGVVHHAPPTAELKAHTAAAWHAEESLRVICPTGCMVELGPDGETCVGHDPTAGVTAGDTLVIGKRGAGPRAVYAVERVDPRRAVLVLSRVVEP